MTKTKTEAMVLEIEKNSISKISCADTRPFLFLSLFCIHIHYSTMIFSMSVFCAMIPNDQILFLKARKRRAASNTSEGFLSVCAILKTAQMSGSCSRLTNEQYQQLGCMCVLTSD